MRPAIVIFLALISLAGFGCRKEEKPAGLFAPPKYAPPEPGGAPTPPPAKGQYNY